MKMKCFQLPSLPSLQKQQSKMQPQRERHWTNVTLSVINHEEGEMHTFANKRPHQPQIH